MMLLQITYLWVLGCEGCWQLEQTKLAQHEWLDALWAAGCHCSS